MGTAQLVACALAIGAVLQCSSSVTCVGQTTIPLVPIGPDAVGGALEPSGGLASDAPGARTPVVGDRIRFSLGPWFTRSLQAVTLPVFQPRLAVLRESCGRGLLQRRVSAGRGVQR